MDESSHLLVAKSLWSVMDESSHRHGLASFLPSCSSARRTTIARHLWTTPCASRGCSLPRGPHRGASPSGGLAPRGGRRSVDSRAFRSQSETRRRAGSSVNYHRPGSSVNYHRPYLFFLLVREFFLPVFLCSARESIKACFAEKHSGAFVFAVKGLVYLSSWYVPSIN